jgi:hypothetical protein
VLEAHLSPRAEHVLQKSPLQKLLGTNGLRAPRRVDKLNLILPFARGYRSLKEQELTKKQREWLALSKKIGPGPMTRSERESLEKLYKEMLPREQQQLFEYIEAHFSKKESQEPEAEEDPISIMQRKVWTPPSPALRAAFSGAGASRPRSTKDEL